MIIKNITIYNLTALTFWNVSREHEIIDISMGSFENLMIIATFFEYRLETNTIRIEQLHNLFRRMHY